MVLNADDPSIAHLGHNLRAKTIYFGLNDINHAFKEPRHASDALKCQNCANFLYFEYFYLSHMGQYKCPQCGFRRPEPQVSASDIKLHRTARMEFVLNLGENQLVMNIPIPGLFNVYNILAAVSVSAALGLDVTEIEKGLKNLRPAFGRGESLEIEHKKIFMFLVKNPAGFNEVLRLLTMEENKKDYLFIINDQIADGKDVSWLWDVDFENIAGKVKDVTLSGRRAHDMALRLKYANLNLLPINFEVEENLEAAVKAALDKTKKGRCLYILPTYTAMLSIRKVFEKLAGIDKFWED